jgi:hypothetical protein
LYPHQHGVIGRQIAEASHEVQKLIESGRPRSLQRLLEKLIDRTRTILEQREPVLDTSPRQIRKKILLPSLAVHLDASPLSRSDAVPALENSPLEISYSSLNFQFVQIGACPK